MLVANAEHRVALIAGEVTTDGQVRAVVVAVAPAGDLLRTRDIDTTEILLGDEVDHARNRIGTVCGAGSAGERFDPVDQRQRNIVQVDPADRTRWDNAVTVEQHDVAVRAEAAKIDVRRAAIAIVDRRADARHDTGNFAQDVFGDV